VTHRVDPAVKEVKPPGPAAIRDAIAVEARGEQLRNRDHPMLPSRQLGDQNLGCAEFVGTIAMNFVHPVDVGASPPAERHAAGVPTLLRAQFVTKHRWISGSRAGARRWAAHAIDVLTLADSGRIAEVTAFIDATQFSRFGLPDELGE
jgi:hypothetical protein